MKKKAIMPVLVLTVICLVVAALLAAVNKLTISTIEENNAEAIKKSLSEVLPGADFGAEPQDIKDELAAKPNSVQAVYKTADGSGFAVIVEARSSYTSGDPLTVTVGISAEGKITGTMITAYSETRDIRQDKTGFLSSFVGQGSDLSGANDAVSGATYTSKAFRSAVQDAFRVLTENNLIQGGNRE